MRDVCGLSENLCVNLIFSWMLIDITGEFQKCLQCLNLSCNDSKKLKSSLVSAFQLTGIPHYTHVSHAHVFHVMFQVRIHMSNTE